MPLAADADLEITALDWVPDFARGYVRDLRPRWACEEAGLAYRERLISVRDKPAWYVGEQPFGQVPYLRDGDLGLFESGAMLLHLGERDERLLPRDPAARAAATCWLFAALNSVEPYVQQLVTIDVFAAGEEWARLRRSGVVEMVERRLDGVAGGLGTREWLAGGFSVADIAMVTVLRNVGDQALIAARPALADYVARGTGRPAYARAMADQLAGLDAAQTREQPQEVPA